MFLRRIPRTRLQIFRHSLWPDMTFRRLALYYWHRMGRMKDAPDAIAAGFATGVAVSFTPFIGFHLMLAAVVTWFLEGSLMAMAVGTVVAGNPWVIPLILVTTYKLGKKMLGATPHVNRVPLEASVPNFWDTLWHKPMEYLLPMTLGCLPFVIVSWVVTFYVARRILSGYREARRKRLQR